MPRQYHGGFVPYRATPEAKRAESFINRDTGEIISRRQYDREFGILKHAGLSSYEQKAAIRKEAGIAPGERGLVITSTKTYATPGTRHLIVRAATGEIQSTIQRIERSIRGKHPAVMGRVKAKDGSWKSTRMVSLGSHDAGGAVGGQLAGLAAEYDFDDDWADDVELAFVYDWQ